MLHISHIFRVAVVEGCNSGVESHCFSVFGGTMCWLSCVIIPLPNLQGCTLSQRGFEKNVFTQSSTPAASVAQATKAAEDNLSSTGEPISFVT